MEHAKIVECYPHSYMVNPGHIDNDKCLISFGGRHLTRIVYRPLEGPELLLEQDSVEFTYDYVKLIHLPPSRLALSNSIVEFKLDLEGRRLHQGWTMDMENLAEITSRYVESKGFYLQGRQPESFMVSIFEVFGEISIMSEGWKNIAPRPPIDVEICTKCDQEMTYEDGIALHCQHVYHKECIMPHLLDSLEPNCYECETLVFP